MLDFGIEIECLLPNGRQNRAEVARAIEAAGVPCFDAGYSHTFERTRWKVVSDASISGGNGVELVSPPLTEAGFDQIEKVSATLLALGATVNRTCGLHVHIGARNHSVGALKKLAELYIKNEPVIDQLLPPSRRGSANTYCKTVTTADMRRLANASSVNELVQAVAPHHYEPGDRFVKLNFAAFWRHGTVEFRHHSGTVDAAKIIKWVTFCSKMVEVAVAEADQPIAVPAVPTMQVNYPRTWRGPRGRRGRQLALLAQMVSREEGVTNEELRVALGIQSRPGIRAQLVRVGLIPHVVGRRGGYEIFRLQSSENPSTPNQTVPAPLTLDELYTKLGLSDEDKAFWAARAARLAANSGLVEHNP